MKHGITVHPADPLPIYAQLERSIKAAVASGALPEGTQLPTVRQLAVDLRVNANTVAKVYLALERDGIVETKRGVGTFVLARPQPPSPSAKRDRQLATLITRFLGEAATLGYSLEEVIAHLVSRAQEEKRHG